MPFRPAWGASEFPSHTYSSLSNTDYDIVARGRHLVLATRATTVLCVLVTLPFQGIRVDICVSDLKLSDFCEVSGTSVQGL